MAGTSATQPNGASCHRRALPFRAQWMLMAHGIVSVAVLCSLLQRWAEIAGEHAGIIPGDMLIYTRA